MEIVGRYARRMRALCEVCPIAPPKVLAVYPIAMLVKMVALHQRVSDEINAKCQTDANTYSHKTASKV